MNSVLAEIQRRPITEDDLPFLCALYANTRAEEMQAVPWTDEEKKAFLDSQFEAQHRHYQEHYAGSDFLVLERDGAPIGRLYVEYQKDEIRLIDIALLTTERGKGLGSALMQELMDQSESRGVPIRLHVEVHNPAYKLYTRLGFVDVEDKGVYMFMERLPGVSG